MKFLLIRFNNDVFSYQDKMIFKNSTSSNGFLPGLSRSVGACRRAGILANAWP
jgi:hypothetical protein